MPRVFDSSPGLSPRREFPGQVRAMRPVTGPERRTPIRRVVNVFESSRIGVRRSGGGSNCVKPRGLGKTNYREAASLSAALTARMEPKQSAFRK